MAAEGWVDLIDFQSVSVATCLTSNYLLGHCSFQACTKPYHKMSVTTVYTVVIVAYLPKVKNTLAPPRGTILPSQVS
jgi:hypothetical protein